MHPGGFLAAMIGGAAALYFAYQRTRYLQWFFRRRRVTENWVAYVKSARAVYAHACPYRPLDPALPDEAAALAKADAAHAGERRTLEAAGFVALATTPDDAVCVRGPDGKLLSVARVMVDAARTTCAILQHPGGIYLESFADGVADLTRRGDAAHIPAGPTLRRHGAAASAPIADLVAIHRTFAGYHEAPPRALAPIADRAALLAKLTERWDAMRAWREQQAPDELLDGDLRGILGAARYKQFGRQLVPGLREALPTATAGRPG